MGDRLLRQETELLAGRAAGSIDQTALEHAELVAGDRAAVRITREIEIDVQWTTNWFTNRSVNQGLQRRRASWQPATEGPRGETPDLPRRNRDVGRPRIQ